MLRTEDIGNTWGLCDPIMLVICHVKSALGLGVVPCSGSREAAKHINEVAHGHESEDEDNV